MAEKLRIFPILKTQLQFDVTPPIFEPLATQVLGNAASDGDGFNADLLAVAQQLESDTALVTAGDKDLADAGFTPGEFAAANIDPLVQQTGTFNSSGDGLLKQLGDDSQIPSSTGQQVAPCGQVTGNFDLPACEFSGRILDLKWQAGPWQVGNCKVDARTRFYDADGKIIYIKQIWFIEWQAAFEAAHPLHDSSDAANLNSVFQMTVNASTKGHYQAVFRIDRDVVGGELYVGVCIDIVNAPELQDRAAQSVLPIQG